mgnify:CR=1 FL=1
MRPCEMSFYAPQLVMGPQTHLKNVQVFAEVVQRLKTYVEELPAIDKGVRDVKNDDTRERYHAILRHRTYKAQMEAITASTPLFTLLMGMANMDDNIRTLRCNFHCVGQLYSSGRMRSMHLAIEDATKRCRTAKAASMADVRLSVQRFEAIPPYTDASDVEVDLGIQLDSDDIEHYL